MSGRRLLVLFAILSNLAGFASAAGALQTAFFRDVVAGTLPTRTAREAPLPRRFRAVAVDFAALARVLAEAPVERDARSLELVLPYPDGSNRRFAVQESSIMEPALAAKFPDIHTYVAQGLDDPTATARLSVTPLGFHALVLSAAGTVLIDPYVRGDSRHALSYFKRDARHARGNGFHCDVIDELAADDAAELSVGAVVPLAASGTQLRTYRLALAATGEYSAAVCAPNPAAVGCAMSAMVVSMNRVDGVYEREVAIRMVLVANDNLIVYTDGTTDPYTNGNGATMLGENQSNLDAVLGSTNYDIGHVFSTGGGGIAQLDVPCTSSKASGVTGRNIPLGDAFDIDYVAHEIGHQFGGDHTFNGTTGKCGGGNRNFSTAYEPGSGTTIMAYAGICGAEDLQPHSDDTFHVRSFDQILAFSTGSTGSSCAAITVTGNHAPTVNAGPAHTIPKQTPFTLTGSANDPDDDSLTYLWEEVDLGSAAPPNDDVAAARPIFRTFVPLLTPSRTLPRLADILSNTATLGESMPTRSRTMTFRLTARDNRAGGGGVNWASTTVTVNAAAGPFVVTQPDTTVSWPGNSVQTVTWNVANTTAAPVSCANVAIDLSTDGGNTWGATLAASTPNDGSENVALPNTPTAQARVRVSCADNIFFDISNTNFTIVADSGNPAPTVTSIFPVSGSVAGGTPVDVNGTGFVNGTTVLFGALAAPTVTFHSDTLLTVTTPAQALGTVGVTVTNPDAKSGTLPSAFAYQLVGLEFYTLSPCRIVDTRNPNGPIGGPALIGGTARSFILAGNCGVPSDAVAVAVNVTVVPSGSGTLNAYASGLVPPPTSVLSFLSGITRANNAVVGLNASGAIDVQTSIPAAGTTHFVLDVNGFFR